LRGWTGIAASSACHRRRRKGARNAGRDRGSSAAFRRADAADDAQDAKGKIEKSEPQSDSLRAAVALAESREATARDELRAAVTREQAALKELEAVLQAGPAAAPSTKPAHDRALLQIADRIEALAAKVEQLP
jgi:cell division protein ZapA